MEDIRDINYMKATPSISLQFLGTTILAFGIGGV